MNYYLTVSQRNFLRSALITIHVSYEQNNTDEYFGKVVLLDMYLIHELELFLNSRQLGLLMSEIRTVDDNTINKFLYTCTYDVT